MLVLPDGDGYSERMMNRRFHREGPGDLPPVDYATNGDELRILSDEEVARIRAAEGQKAKSDEAIAIAKAPDFELMTETERKDSDTRSEIARAEFKKGLHDAHVDARAKAIDAAAETMRTMSDAESEASRTGAEARLASERKDARFEAHVDARGEWIGETGQGLEIMTDAETKRSIENEAMLERGRIARLAAERDGLPIADETIEMVAPEGYSDDPEFRSEGARMRLVDTNAELQASIENARSVEERRRRESGTHEYVELSAPEDPPGEALVEEASETSPELVRDSLETEREEWESVLGKANAVRRKPKANGGDAAEKARWESVLGKKKAMTNEEMNSELEAWAKTEPGTNSGAAIETIDPDVIAERAEWEKKLGKPSTKRKVPEAGDSGGIFKRIRSWFGG